MVAGLVALMVGCGAPRAHVAVPVVSTVPERSPSYRAVASYLAAVGASASGEDVAAQASLADARLFDPSVPDVRPEQVREGVGDSGEPPLQHDFFEALATPGGCEAAAEIAARAVQIAANAGTIADPRWPVRVATARRCAGWTQPE